MNIKALIDEDFVNYKKPSMFIGTSYCTFKCERENSECHCQNSNLSKSSIINIDDEKLVERYIKNNITKSVVIGGLEPMDTFEELISFIDKFRNRCDDDVVIFTGYYEEEVSSKIEQLKKYKNIIIKFGRFIPNQEKHFDEVLGVNLASKNQYALKIS